MVIFVQALNGEVICYARSIDEFAKAYAECHASGIHFSVISTGFPITR